MTFHDSRFLPGAGRAQQLTLVAALLVGVFFFLMSPWGRQDAPQGCLFSTPRVAGVIEGDDVLQRFRWATTYIRNVIEPSNYTLYPVWQCPDDTRVGRRPPAHTEEYMGTTCEPWMHRGAVVLLHELLLPGTAKALEWSSGSSSVFLLRGHVSRLYSIEHHPEWSKLLVESMERIFGKEALENRWSMHHIPPTPPTILEGEDPEVFADYVKADFLDNSHLGTFDYVSIDGRARIYCFKRALELLKPHGGVLVLDNAERPYYKQGIDSVPSHWLRYTATNKVDKTIVWVSCLEGSC